MGKCTWMKYLEQEPLVARTKRHRPQPVLHTAGPREVRWGERQDGQNVQSMVPLRPSEPTLPFREESCSLRAGRREEGRDHLFPILVSPEHTVW